jgi:hypothetical protein
MRERKREAQWGMGQKMENGPGRGQKKNEERTKGGGGIKPRANKYIEISLWVWGIEGMGNERRDKGRGCQNLCPTENKHTGPGKPREIPYKSFDRRGRGRGKWRKRKEEPNCDEQANSKGGWRRGRTTYVL